MLGESIRWVRTRGEGDDRHHEKKMTRDKVTHRVMARVELAALL